MRTKTLRGFLLALLAGETKVSATWLTFQLMRVTDGELIEALMTFPLTERCALKQWIAFHRKRGIDLISQPPKSAGQSARPPLSGRTQSGTSSKQYARQRRLAGLSSAPVDFNPFR